jgi:hypothetical protein
MSESWWCIAVIPATGEAEIERTKVSGQPRQKVSGTTISTNNGFDGASL